MTSPGALVFGFVVMLVICVIAAIAQLTPGGQARARAKARTRPYYVVNVGRGQATHISASIPHPVGVVTSVVTGICDSSTTLCGLQATRHVDVFTPGEASCRECRKRWQLATRPAAPRVPG